MNHQYTSVALLESELLPAVLLSPAELMRLHASDGSCNQLRQVTAVLGLIDRGPPPCIPQMVDAFITRAEFESVDLLCRVISRIWRKRLAATLSEHAAGGAVKQFVQYFANADVPPSAVKLCAYARGTSREHLTRQLKEERGLPTAFCPKRISDAFVVFHILVLRALRQPIGSTVASTGISYRTYLRAQQRMERVLPGPIDNFRSMLMQMEVVTGADSLLRATPASHKHERRADDGASTRLDEALIDVQR